MPWISAILWLKIIFFLKKNAVCCHLYSNSIYAEANKDNNFQVASFNVTCVFHLSSREKQLFLLTYFSKTNAAAPELLLCSNKLGDTFLSLVSGWQTGFQHIY